MSAKFYMKALLLLLLSISLSKSSTCNGNCPGGGCSVCYCGTTQNYIDIEDICKEHSWDQSMCQCIVEHESGGNANALNFNEDDSTYDIGVFQINTVNWKINSGNPPCNVTQNLLCAIEVYKYGDNTFKYWTTYAGCLDKLSFSLLLNSLIFMLIV